MSGGKEVCGIFYLHKCREDKEHLYVVKSREISCREDRDAESFLPERKFFRRTFSISFRKQKFLFQKLFHEILPDYTLQEDMLDEGVSVLYNTISGMLEAGSAKPDTEYQALEESYEVAEDWIPTRLKEYERQSREDYFKVKNNFYHLFFLAEQVKKHLVL